ncbi:type II secretion system protein E [Verminephrobacter eiseniae EF01-2]|uniref:Type II secretion system protein E n=4 Tax=Verminephrobacter eiseniae TaxID=364317 RepID=A1WP60_VEREI|nr:type II secretion system protein E [Verminephrobacter eiseniae EF01-2]MCW5284940.1 hypothetical protein [Verminephrobacter eiseniae]MCW5302648.1 hypothetical protein [Verminephrobacter eiseniae]MCW8189023.1 hypothetical protein [Verminephrobacter eiseniae]
MNLLHRLARTAEQPEEAVSPQPVSGRSFRVDMKATLEPQDDSMSAARPPEGEGTPVSAKSPEVIRQIADFPPHKDVLTSPRSPNIGLRIPAEFQDMIIAIGLEATRARVALDPQFEAQVARYIPPIRSALGAAGVWVHRTPLLADASVIRAVRLNAERGADTTSCLGGKSDGANLFREWVTLAKEEKATDLHIRILDGGLAEVLMRVDGELEPITGSDRGLFTKFDALDAMKSAYEMLSDRHSNSSGTFSESETLSSMIDTALGIANIRLRFSCLRGLYGPKAVVRLLASSAADSAMTFASMGFAPSHIELFERAQRLDCGAIGQMGITGSGKTTTAKTFVEAHPKYGRSAMYQVADPIEYPMLHMHQIYVQRSLLTLNEHGKKDPYNVAIESLMRSDPDLVDVGEVRDILSARAMANVAKSGHLSMFTLHVGSIAGAINRLTDPHIGLTRQELTGAGLLGLLDYQALVPILCPRCCMDQAGIVDCLHRAGDGQSLREARYIRYLARTINERFDIEPRILRFRNLSGCEHCRRRGTTGLTICAEILLPDDDWLDLSAAGKDREAMRDWRLRFSDKNPTSENMNGKLVIEHALYKACKGVIDPRNIERFGQLATLEILP